LDKHGTAIADTDPDPHTDAKSDSIDLSDSFCVADTHSHVQ